MSIAWASTQVYNTLMAIAAGCGLLLMVQVMPQRLFIICMGCVLLSIAVAGITYHLFAAPAAEPLTGLLANYPWVEAWFISLLYAGVGVVALLLPLCLNEHLEGRLTIQVTKLAKVLGVILVLFGIMNYFTHIGLIVHTQ